MDAQHELVSKVKEMAVELGRTPTRAEFCQSIKGGDYKLNKIGGFTVLLQQAGLDTYDSRRGKPAARVDNTIFQTNLERHLENYEPRPSIDRKPYPRILSISDIHWPFGSQRVINKFYRFVEDLQPAFIFINGDAWDMYSHSKYPRSHNVFTPRDEERLSRQMNEEFWTNIKKMAPAAKCIQMMGNHDIRPMKRVLEAYPEAEDWIKEKLTKLFTFDGVETIFDPRQEYEIGDILVFHGYRSKLGDHRDYTLFNTINGHTHLGGSVFRKVRGAVLWELNSGLAGDPEAKGLTYTPQKIMHWTPGFGMVDEHGPRFIPA